MDAAGEARFAEFVVRKTAAANDAAFAPLETIGTGSDSAPSRWSAIGNAWTRRYYDGDFLLPPAPPQAPAVSLVFVQSADGNTGTRRPDELGGGAADLHLIYEGLSRVAADAVAAGASTVKSGDVFFSVWRKELVDLRQSLGLPRHPAQVVVSKNGSANLDSTLLFNVPDVPVFVIAGELCRRRCALGFARRPWITILPIGPDGLGGAFERLKANHGIGRISCIGGRTLASSLLAEGLVQDVCLTTTAKTGGEPDTPFYGGGTRPRLEPVVRKRGVDASHPIVFEQLAVKRAAP